jgi:hypothetical protein
MILMFLPGRLLLGQQNPWHHMLKNLKKVDCILHIGDQIYPDNEDIAHAGGLFGKLYDGLVTLLRIENNKLVFYSI